jgi:hypothetical protein
MSALVLGIVFYADVSRGDPGWQVVRDLITVTVSVELGYIIGAPHSEKSGSTGGGTDHECPAFLLGWGSSTPKLSPRRLLG